MKLLNTIEKENLQVFFGKFADVEIKGRNLDKDDIDRLIKDLENLKTKFFDLDKMIKNMER